MKHSVTADPSDSGNLYSQCSIAIKHFNATLYNHNDNTQPSLNLNLVVAYWTSLSFKSSKSNSTNPTNQAARLAIGFTFCLFFFSLSQCPGFSVNSTDCTTQFELRPFVRTFYICCVLQQTWLPLFQKVANRPLVMWWEIKLSLQEALVDSRRHNGSQGVAR